MLHVVFVQPPLMSHSLWLWFRCRDLDPGSAESREPFYGNPEALLVFCTFCCCIRAAVVSVIDTLFGFFSICGTLPSNCQQLPAGGWCYCMHVRL
jgi:hypothetical protein